MNYPYMAGDFAFVLTDPSGGAVDAVLNGVNIRAFVEPLKNEELLSAPGGVDMEMIQVFARSSDTGSLAPGQIITFNGQRWQVMHFFDLDGVSKMMLGRNYA